jgi:hypothetical protein
MCPEACRKQDLLFHCLGCYCGKQERLHLDLAALISFLRCASYIESI